MSSSASCKRELTVRDDHASVNASFTTTREMSSRTYDTSRYDLDESPIQDACMAGDATDLEPKALLKQCSVRFESYSTLRIDVQSCRYDWKK